MSLYLSAKRHRRDFVPPRRNIFCEYLVPGFGRVTRHHNSEIAREIRNDQLTLMLCSIICLWRSAMSKLGILAATALSLTLALAAPASAAGRGGGGGAHFGGGGGAHFGGGAMRMGGGTAAFRGAQASMGPSRAGPVGGAQFARGGFRGHDRRGFGAGAGFVAGLAAGGALGYGYPYYGDDYAYDDYYDGGYPVDQPYVASPGYVVSGGADPAYCAQRYRSYDPASGTYLGYDGLRHPCGE
jgi:hypothetical protein